MEHFVETQRRAAGSVGGPPHNTLLNLPFPIKPGRGVLTHTSFPVLGQCEAAVALADKGAQNIHTELLTAVVLRRTQILDWGRVVPLEPSSEGDDPQHTARQQALVKIPFNILNNCNPTIQRQPLLTF